MSLSDKHSEYFAQTMETLGVPTLPSGFLTDPYFENKLIVTDQKQPKNEKRQGGRLDLERKSGKQKKKGKRKQCVASKSKLEDSSSSSFPHQGGDGETSGKGPEDDLPQLSWQMVKMAGIIDRGDSAAVFQGEVQRPGESGLPVAIKVPHCPSHFVQRNMIETEARVLHRLAGAGGTPRLIGLIKGTRIALVMELSRGVSLHHYVRSHSEPDRALVI